MLNMARDQPRRFAATEIAALSGSAVGEAVAEEAFPGSLAARLAGGIAGGFFSVPRLLTGLGGDMFQQGWNGEANLHTRGLADGSAFFSSFLRCSTFGRCTCSGPSIPYWRLST